MNLPNLPSLTNAERTTLELWATSYQQGLLDSLKPPADAFGLRQLPREPNNPNKFLSTFKTDNHTYTIIGDGGIGFERYTIFQKRSLQRGFGRDFQQVWDTLQGIKINIASERELGKLRSEAIISITGLQDSVADFGREQFDAALWLCTLFILREDETMAAYSETIAEEKIRDWAAFGFSELDFFFLSGNLIPGYMNAFRQAVQSSEKLRHRLMDAINTNGQGLRENES